MADKSPAQIAEERIAIAARDQATSLDLSNYGLQSLPESLDHLTNLRELHLDSNQLSSLPESLGHLTTLQELHLDSNQLSSLPESLGNLTDLKSLFLDGNGLSSLPESLGKLTNLRELHLGGNRLSSLPESLGKLTKLQLLRLGGNRLSSLPESLGRLASLRYLSLEGNGLSSLPGSLGKLTKLERLHLNDNQLLSPPECLGQLTGLQQLYLDGNQLSSLPEFLSQLTNLQSLYLGNNRLPSVPESLGQLTKLEYLFLDGNGLSSVPGFLGQLTGLQSLFLDGNRLSSVPESLGQLTNLRYLSLGGNRLSSVPESLGRLTKLEHLSLGGNQLSSLPESLGRLTNLRRLFLHNNPALRLPPEVLGPTWQEIHGGTKPADPKAILAHYFASRRSGSRSMNEAKLLIVGQGRVGKTSLVRYLIDGMKCDSREQPTEGIRRTPWLVPVKPPRKRKREGVTLNVWDFGGQEILHATHQFFLTKRSLYLLVLDAGTSEAENNLFYWLKVIRSFGGDAPVLVVVNKFEGSLSLDLNESRLRADHPNIRGFLRVSCRTGKGIPDLKKAIAEQLASLDHVFDPLPGPFFAVKQDLEGWAARRTFITIDEYRALCARHKLTAKDEQARLLRFLHDLGVALNFDDPDDPYDLGETNVLDPVWVTDAVYRVITNSELKDNKGVLRRDDLATILSDHERFPKETHGFIIELMRKFELCFDFPDSSGERFLVPGLLPKDEPESAGNRRSPPIHSTSR